MANSQKFTLTFDAQLNVGQMKGALSNIQSELNKLKLPAGVDKGLQDTFTKLSNEIKNFENLTNKSSFTSADFKQVEKSATKISDLFSHLQSQVKTLGSLSNKELQKLFPADTVKKIEAGEKALDSYQSTIDQLNNKLATANDRLKALQTKLQVRIQNKDTAQANVDNLINSAQSINDLAKTEGVKQDIQTYKELEAALKAARQAKDDYDKAVGSGSRKANSITEAGLNKTISRLEAVKKAYDDQTNAIKTAQQVLTAAKGQVTRTYNEIAEAQLNLTQAQKEAFAGSATAIQQLFQDLSNAGFDTSKYKPDIDNAKQAVDDYVAVIRNQLLASIQSVDNALNSNEQAYEDNRREVEENALANQRLDERMRDVSALKSRIQYFFGLSNAINLVKRAIRGAFDTIKELDKVMTETAVVTDFSVSDMWEQLPEYTKRANELGVTTKAAYEAATLYYQQGLKTNEVNALSVETLKMARIAGLDAAEATDRMTNALRGFNMELTEANAQRVDDVYSELAANTASNVDEISTAMTKVASLAHNANMEFETTAAFLSQIIETTRESAETAGTALKTVVARFSEVKKLIDEGSLRGTDEEGQAIDVNRVGQALRTAGIDLNKYFLGEVGLDDIFMELASKWDSLTSVQQRYIATQAAGSRQQSRFIALMQDYARTQELVGKAYNASGASARQFAKTQESLESKLNRLKNAWNEFLMGLTNNVVVKSFVDLLTDLLNAINKVTSAFGDGAGSILKWGVALGSIFGGKALFRTGGLVESILGAVTQNTVFGNALTRAGVLGQAGSAAAGATGGVAAARTPLIFGSGSLLSKAGKGLWDQAQILGLAVKGGKAGGGLGAAKETFSFLGGNLGADATVAGLTGIGTALGAIAVAVGLVVAGYQAWLHLTPEGQLKQAKQIAEVMNDVAANTQNAANEMKQARDSYREYTSAVQSASNIEERNEAIQNRNEYINSLLEQNEAFAKYVSTEIKEGQLVLTVDDTSLNEAIQTVAEAATRAATGADLANAMQAGKQADIFEARLAGVDLENRTIRSYDEYGNEITRALTGAEYAKFAQYAQAAANARAEQRTYAAQGYSRQLESSGLEDDVASMLANAMADAFNEDQYLKDINAQRSENWWNGEATLDQLRASYKELYGIDAGDMKRGDLARAVAQGQVDRERAIDLTDLTTLLQGAQKDQYQALLEAYQGQGKMAEINLEGQSFEEILSQLGFNELTEKQIDNFATKLGLTTKELNEHIAAVAEDTKQIQAQARADVFETMMRAGMTITTADQARINGMTPEQIQQINETAIAADGLLFTEDYQGLINGLINGLIEGTISQEFASQLTTLFDSIDLNNPIGAFHALAAAKKEATQAGNEELLDYIEKIEEANKEIISASNLVQSFVASADYDELTESLDKFIKENGKIAADNIEELAKESKTLKSLLDSDTVSVKALANALTLIQEGKLGFEQLTDALLEALEAGKSFEEVIEDVDKWIKDFDPGTDLKEGTEHMVEQLESLKEYVSNWEFGNEPTENIYDHIFGKGKYQEALKNFINDSKTDFVGFEKYLQGQIAKYSGYAENAGLGGIQTASKKIEGLKEIAGSGGQFFEWDLSQFDNTTQAIDAVAKALGVSQEAAEAFILSWQTHMPALKTEWDELNYQTQLETFIDNLGDAQIATEQDLIALGAAVDETGHVSQEALQEVIDKINEIRAKSGKDPIEIPVIVNWQDDSGNALSDEELLTRYKQQFGDGEPITITRPVILDESFEGSRSYEGVDSAFADLQQYITAASNTVDAEGVLNHLLSQGLTNSQAEEIANDFISQLNGAMLTKTIQVPEFTKDENNNIINVTQKDVVITADTMDGLRQAEEAALQNANYDLVGQQLAGINLDAYGTKVYDTTSTNITNSATAAWDSFVEAVSKSTIYIPYAFSGMGLPSIPGFIGGASGGIVKSRASGSNRELSAGFALTGEEGPEIVWNKLAGYAYITGHNGPEFQNLQPGDRVFNAAETSRIFRNSSFARGGIFDSFASGGWKPTKPTVNSSGNKDSKKESTWRNELDWLYDLMDDIAEYEHQQVLLQSKYELYLKDVSKTGRDLYSLTKQELTNLKTQLNAQQAVQTKRLQQMGELQTQVNAAGYGKYVQYNQKDRTLEINWDKIEAIQDKEKYDEVTEWISRMEEVQDQIEDAEKSIFDIKKQIQDLQDRYLQSYLDFQNRVMDALVQSYQDQIDSLSTLNDTLNDTNNNILNSIQKEIDLERQIRDNTDTEQNIADMEARLALLQRDTTGANATAIRQLEKQLADARESYSDTLVDQAIDRLSQSNEEAATQREKQIELMQAQLDYWKESGALWGEVNNLIKNGFNGDGSILLGSELANLLKDADDWKAMSQAQRDNWANELILNTNEVGAHIITMTEGMNYQAGKITALLTSLTGKLGGTPKHSYAATKTEEKYATGGLNTYTGWAHLDGTPSEPEYVLNARQTDAFLRLADVLPNMMNNSSNTTSNFTSNPVFNIAINVDSISNDYDVDKLVDRVKDDLTNALNYRNVNALSFIR